MKMLFDNTCVLCHAERLIYKKKEFAWGIESPEKFCCENCGSTFIEDELKWKLIDTKDKSHPIWKEFRQRSLYVREWFSIGHLIPVDNALNFIEGPLTSFKIFN